MRPDRFFHSLRFKITAGIALPLLVILSAYSYLQYIRERDLLLSNLDATTTNLGNVIVGSLEHAMLSQDLPEIQGIVKNIAKQQGIRDVFLMNRRAQVRFAPDAGQVGRSLSLSDTGCVECHGPDVSQHTSSIIFTNAEGERVFRNCKAIPNQVECQACHSIDDRVNGVLITDISMGPVDDLLTAGLRTNILWSVVLILATVLVLNALMSRMVVTKIERLVEAVQAFSRGNLSFPISTAGADEIGELAGSFSRMAHQVAEHNRELERLNDELRRKEVLRGQLLSQVITAQEEERKRIARDLHDQLGQALSAMTMGMEAAERALSPSQDGLRDRLFHAKSLATRALEQTHELILDLRPVALDDLGLIAAMRSYAEQHLLPRGVEVQVSTQGSARRLAPELEIALFRIVQEAINNIANHANAQHVHLSIAFAAAGVRVRVEDDGCGFDPDEILQAGDHDRGFGLLGMQERAALAEGSVVIDSQPGAGTRIEITLPA